MDKRKNGIFSTTKYETCHMTGNGLTASVGDAGSNFKRPAATNPAGATRLAEFITIGLDISPKAKNSNAAK